MAVVAYPQDTDGKLLDAKIASLTTALANTTSTLTKHQIAKQLDQAQREALLHYVEHGRLNAALILSTMS